MYCGLSTASEVFLTFTAQLYQYLSLFALFSKEPEVFLPKYSQTAILHAAHFRRVVKDPLPLFKKSKVVILVAGGRWRGVARPFFLSKNLLLFT